MSNTSLLLSGQCASGFCENVAWSHPNWSYFSIINRKRKTVEDKSKASMFLTDWLGFGTAFSSTIWVMSGVSKQVSEEFSKQARWYFCALFSFCCCCETELWEFHFRWCWELWVSGFQEKLPDQSSRPRNILILWSPVTPWFPKSRSSSALRLPGPQHVSNEGGRGSEVQALQPRGGCCRPCSQEAENLRSSGNHMLQPLSSEPLGPR